MHNLTRTELEEIISNTVQQTLETALPKALESFGIDGDNPLEMQSDFKFIRNMRRGYETSLFRAFGGLVTAATLGIAYMIWDHLKK